MSPQPYWGGSYIRSWKYSSLIIFGEYFFSTLYIGYLNLPFLLPTWNLPKFLFTLILQKIALFFTQTHLFPDSFISSCIAKLPSRNILTNHYFFYRNLTFSQHFQWHRWQGRPIFTRWAVRDPQTLEDWGMQQSCTESIFTVPLPRDVNTERWSVVN